MKIPPLLKCIGRLPCDTLVLKIHLISKYNYFLKISREVLCCTL